MDSFANIHPVLLVGAATLSVTVAGALLATVRTLSAHGTRIAELEAQARRARDYRQRTFERLAQLEAGQARITGMLEQIIRALNGGKR